MLAAAALGSVLALAVCGRFVDWDTVFVNGMGLTLNDQVGYISVARHLVDTGRLESSGLSPAALAQPHTKGYFYVPGHYYALAASYVLFGFSAAHSFWPSMAAFLLSSLLTVVIASALFGRQRALSSWALFALFPLNLVYAFTAMAEMTVLASALAAFAMFLWLPRGWRPWLGPAALALPLLFRETGFLIAVLMAGVVYKDSGGKWKPVAQFCLLSVLIAALVLTSPVASGRPSLLRQNLFEGTDDYIYGSAFSSSGLTPSPADWAAAIATKFAVNVIVLFLGPFSTYRPGCTEVLSLYFVLSGIPLSLMLWRRKRNIVYLSIFSILSVLLLAILCLYTVWWFRGIRTMLLVQPFVAMLWADWYQSLEGNVRHRNLVAGLAGILLTVAAVAGVHSVYGTETATNHESAMDTAFLESIGHDTSGVLASPFKISLDYVLKHHPAKWIYLPSDDRTLQFVDSKYKVSTLVLPDGPGSTRLTPAGIASVGLVEQKHVSYGGQGYRIFTRLRPAW